MKKLLGLLIILFFVGISQSQKEENYMKKDFIKDTIKNYDIDQLDPQEIQQRATDLIRKVKRTIKDDMHEIKTDAIQLSRKQTKARKQKNNQYLQDLRPYMENNVDVEEMDYDSNDMMNNNRSKMDNQVEENKQLVDEENKQLVDEENKQLVDEEKVDNEMNVQIIQDEIVVMQEEKQDDEEKNQTNMERCQMLIQQLLLQEVQLVKLYSYYDMKNQYRIPQYLIQNMFSTSVNIKDNCFQAYLEVSSASPQPLDITQYPTTLIDLVYNEYDMVQFSISSDNLDRLCMKIEDQNQYDCKFTFKIMSNNEIIYSWLITQQVSFNQPEGRLDLGNPDVIKQNNQKDMEQQQAKQRKEVESEIQITENDFKTQHKGPYQAGESFYIVHRILDGELKTSYYLRLKTAQLITGEKVINLVPLELSNDDIDMSSGQYRFIIPSHGQFQLRIVSELVNRSQKKRQLFSRNYDISANIYEKQADIKVNIEVIPAKEKQDSREKTTIIVLVAIFAMSLMLIIGNLIFFQLKQEKGKRQLVDENSNYQLQQNMEIENRHSIPY